MNSYENQRSISPEILTTQERYESQSFNSAISAINSSYSSSEGFYRHLEPRIETVPDVCVNDRVSRVRF